MPTPAVHQLPNVHSEDHRRRGAEPQNTNSLGHRIRVPTFVSVVYSSRGTSPKKVGKRAPIAGGPSAFHFQPLGSVTFLHPPPPPELRLSLEALGPPDARWIGRNGPFPSWKSLFSKGFPLVVLLRLDKSGLKKTDRGIQWVSVSDCFFFKQPHGKRGVKRQAYLFVVRLAVAFLALPPMFA